MLEVRFLPPAARYLKKLKDKKLLELYRNALNEIRKDYRVGELKKGDLAGIYCYDIYYNRTNYELAYRVIEENGELIVVIMAGTRENFYEELKRYMN